MAPLEPDKEGSSLLRQSTLTHIPGAASIISFDHLRASTQTDVLLAIKPVRLAHIASQQKNHEYRKYRLPDEVVRLWFYETRDGTDEGRSSITTRETLGIGDGDFNAGRKVSKYGYPVLELYELARPVALDEIIPSLVVGIRRSR
ncbi:hypothetical protein B0T26DRAFT_805070 [Lasiosphaeria miniovina]|uniref:Uncharacterized protein n=1 Tax=Lasiosphaeria miniovina TaxID=1954250 RepID=A0AA40DQB1_9PEZI|nr:uncharacterized protein B0T26DRAFT_805070 [Lasiosphaeria miniovina]KAK0709327.1 hypothetical protein B0T26DRAFT_805070 [Lasiosphaeria miniovina]